MDLQYFPMDRQLCYIEIESCKYKQDLLQKCVKKQQIFCKNVYIF